MTKVLIIDDNADGCETLIALTAMLGHRAECVTDPRQALSVAQRLKPDLVLLDIVMPYIDGWALAPLLREVHPEVRICAVSAYNSSQDRQESLRAGCDAHVGKPLAAELLRRLLEP